MISRKTNKIKTIEVVIKYNKTVYVHLEYGPHFYCIIGKETEIKTRTIF